MRAISSPTDLASCLRAANTTLHGPRETPILAIGLLSNEIFTPMREPVGQVSHHEFLSGRPVQYLEEEPGGGGTGQDWLSHGGAGPPTCTASRDEPAHPSAAVLQMADVLRSGFCRAA